MNHNILLFLFLLAEAVILTTQDNRTGPIEKLGWLLGIAVGGFATYIILGQNIILAVIAQMVFIFIFGGFIGGLYVGLRQKYRKKRLMAAKRR
jgi:hypothetical protein